MNCTSFSAAVRRGVVRFFSDGLNVVASMFALVTTAIVAVSYYAVTFFGNRRYMQWAEQLDGGNCTFTEEHPIWQPMPDVFFTDGRFNDPSGVVATVATAIPFVCLICGFAVCLLFRYADIFSYGMMCIAFLITGKGIAGNVTTIPASAGYKLCVKKLGGNSALPFSFQIDGVCSDMIWSGHTLNTMIGVYVFYAVLERRWPSRFGKNLGGDGGIALRTLVVLAFGLLDATLLVLSSTHYTVDVFLAILITMLLLSNDTFKYWAFRVNPFLKKRWSYSTYRQKAKDLDQVMELLAVKYPAVHADVVVACDSCCPDAKHVPNEEAASPASI